jgi:iron complex outermembrane receptor protein
MNRFIAIMGAILCAHSLCAQQFSGVITNRSTNQPIQGATISILDVNIQTISDSLGRFSFVTNLPSHLNLQISAQGFETTVLFLESSPAIQLILLTEKHVSLDEVTISGSKGMLQRLNAIHIETRKISDLNAIPTTNLGEALATIPGVYNSSTGNGISKPVIRGMQGIRVVSLLNGLRIENQQWGGDHGMGITELGIGTVEVIKGPSSLLYGADALGGVIYYEDEPFALQNELQVGAKTQFETNTLGTNNQLSYKLSKNNIRLTLVGSYTNHADFMLPNGSFLINSRFNENGFKAAFGTNYRNWGMSIRYNYSSSSIGIPGETEDSIPTPLSFQSTIQNRGLILPSQKFHNHFLSIQNSWYLRKQTMSLLVGETVNRLQEFEDNKETAALNMVLSNTLYHLKAITKFNGKFNFVYGLQGMLQDNSNDPTAEEKLIPSSFTYDNGIYGLVYFKQKKWNTQAGIRGDIRIIHTRENFNGYDAVKKQFPSLNFSLGTVRSGKETTARINVSSGFRAPHLSELLANGAHDGALRYEIGDLNMKAEKASQLDLTYEIHKDHLELIVNPFGNYIRDYILLTPIDSTIDGLPVYKYKQMNQVWLFGSDIAIHFHPHFAHWLHLESNYSFIQAESKSENLALMPQNRISSTMRFDFKMKSWIKLTEIVVQHSYLFEQNRVASFETTSAAYQLINIGTNWKLGKRSPVTLGLGVKNLLNANYMDHLSRLKNIQISQPGRSVYVSMRYTFKKVI